MLSLAAWRSHMKMYDAHFYYAEVTVPALPFLHPSEETNEKQKAGWSRVSPEMQESDTNGWRC